MKAHKGIRVIVPHTSIIRWRCVVDFTPQLHHPREEPEYTVNTKLGGSQRCTERFGKEKKVLLAREFEP